MSDQPPVFKRSTTLTNILLFTIVCVLISCCQKLDDLDGHQSVTVRAAPSVYGGYP